MNSTSYSCQCPQPYSGSNCNITNSICNYVSCGQGVCVQGSSYPNYSCKCNAGYSGSACNIKDQVCLTSPCSNGATCTDLGGLNYTCKCPVEYDGINCQNRKQSTYKRDYFTEIYIFFHCDCLNSHATI